MNEDDRVRRLVEHTCGAPAPGPSPPPPDLRLGPTLPPEAAISRAMFPFDEMPDLAAEFEGMRLGMLMQGVQRPDTQLPHDDGRGGSGSGGSVGFSFARCMLGVLDPTLPLLSEPDASARVSRFVDDIAAQIEGRQRPIARAFAAHRPDVWRSLDADVVAASMVDPVKALSDHDLVGAVVQHLADSVVRTTVIVRSRARTDHQPTTRVFLSSHAGQTSLRGGSAPRTCAGGRAVLVQWNDSREAYEIAPCGGSSLADVQRHLLAAEAVAPHQSMSLADLSAIAARCAVLPPPPSVRWRSKAAVLAALCPPHP